MQGFDGAGHLELVRLSGVHKYYPGGATGVNALHDIHFGLARGEMLAICGQSGSGKTALLNIVGLLEPTTGGTVVLDSLLVARLSEQARVDLRTELIGYVFQNVCLIPMLTALENVLLPLQLRRNLQRDKLDAAQRRAGELLTGLGLAAQGGHLPSRLDASQIQRVAVARALIGKPKLVVADEPLSRQDPGCARMITDLFAQEQRRHGTAVLITTRDQRHISRATRTLQLAEGRLIQTASAAARTTLRVHL